MSQANKNTAYIGKHLFVPLLLSYHWNGATSKQQMLGKLSWDHT